MKGWELKRRVVEAFGDTVTNFVSRGDETLLVRGDFEKMPVVGGGDEPTGWKLPCGERCVGDRVLLLLERDGVESVSSEANSERERAGS